MPPHDQLDSNTFAAFADMDASPTRTWLIEQALNSTEYHPWFEHAFAQRPAEELYELKSDPDQWTNLAADPNFAPVREELSKRLMQILTTTGDPRVITTPPVFDLPPFSSDPEQEPRKKNPQKTPAAN
jgi:uncharacterized sulfatase